MTAPHLNTDFLILPDAVPGGGVRFFCRKADRAVLDAQILARRVALRFAEEAAFPEAPKEGISHLSLRPDGDGDKVAKKSPGEKEDEQVERLLHREPKKKPPRYDSRRRSPKDDNDPDDRDKPTAEKDRDMSQNYKRIAIRKGIAKRAAAAYLGVREQRMDAETPWLVKVESEITASDEKILLDRARAFKASLSSFFQTITEKDTLNREALDQAIRNSPYEGSVGSNLYHRLLGRLMGQG